MLPHISILHLEFLNLSSQLIDFSQVDIFDRPQLFELDVESLISSHLAISIVIKLNLRLPKSILDIKLLVFNDPDFITKPLCLLGQEADILSKVASIVSRRISLIKRLILRLSSLVKLHLGLLKPLLEHLDLIKRSHIAIIQLDQRSLILLLNLHQLLVLALQVSHSDLHCLNLLPKGLGGVSLVSQGCRQGFLLFP